MKFCPYCGADLLKEDAAFCAECGKKLSVAEEAPSPAHEADSQHDAKPSKQKVSKKGSQKRRQPKPKKEKVQKPSLPEIEGKPVEDGYDGYYDDVLPPDLNREKEGLDKELIKKIVTLTVAVILIIGLCVVMMYVL